MGNMQFSKEFECAMLGHQYLSSSLSIQFYILYYYFLSRHSWNAKKMAHPKLVQPQTALEFELQDEESEEEYQPDDDLEECGSPILHPYNIPYHSTHNSSTPLLVRINPVSTPITYHIIVLTAAVPLSGKDKPCIQPYNLPYSNNNSSTPLLVRKDQYLKKRK